MTKYVFKYWFEWGGTCLWSDNDAAREEFGYAVDEQTLPLSQKLKDLLFPELTDSHDGGTFHLNRPAAFRPAFFQDCALSPGKKHP